MKAVIMHNGELTLENPQDPTPSVGKILVERQMAFVVPIMCQQKLRR